MCTLAPGQSQHQVHLLAEQYEATEGHRAVTSAISIGLIPKVSIFLAVCTSLQLNLIFDYPLTCDIPPPPGRLALSYFSKQNH